MGWPYEFLDLSDAERLLRRQTLDKYAFYAQLSAVLPAALFLLYRATTWAISAAKTSSGGSYDAIPNSPSLKSRRLSNAGTATTHLRQLQWWLDDDMVLFGQVWGRRDQWIGGALWGIWLALLCVLGTGSDYLHITKRFGAIAVSQFPVQYLLALKSLNPFAFAFRSSHERINRWHRVLGRLIYALLCLHGVFYLNYFLQMGIFLRRMTNTVVALGPIAFIGFTFLSATSLRLVRNYSYRLFFVTHLVVAMGMPIFVLFHARSSTTFMAEAILVLIADLVSRKIDTITSQATLEPIPGTNLIRISASVPYSKINRFREHPGSHIYLSVPAAARPSANPTSSASLLFEFLYNPFTVANVDDQNNDLTLVVRHLGGPLTSTLSRFAQAGTASRHGDDDDAAFKENRVPLSIEGPYGVATHFPHLSSGEFDRILLVAGGVGATFTVPLYRSLMHENPNAKVEMVWAVRDAGEATWAVAGNEAKSIMDDENVHIFLTGNILGADANLPSFEPPTSLSESSTAAGRVAGSGGSEVEMSALYRDRRRNRYTSEHNRRRPDLQKIVDNVFRHGAEERVAVLVCGPTPMSRELRDHVSVWVMKGRIVWWHSENFDW